MFLFEIGAKPNFFLTYVFFSLSNRIKPMNHQPSKHSYFCDMEEPARTLSNWVTKKCTKLEAAYVVSKELVKNFVWSIVYLLVLICG